MKRTNKKRKQNELWRLLFDKLVSKSIVVSWNTMWSISLWFNLWVQEVSLATCLKEIAVLCLVFCDCCVSSKYTDVECTKSNKICKPIKKNTVLFLFFLLDSNLAAFQWLRLTQQSTAMGQEGLPPWVIYGLALLWRSVWFLGCRTVSLSFPPVFEFLYWMSPAGEWAVSETAVLCHKG